MGVRLGRSAETGSFVVVMCTPTRESDGTKVPVIPPHGLEGKSERNELKTREKKREEDEEIYTYELHGGIHEPGCERYMSTRYRSINYCINRTFRATIYDTNKNVTSSPSESMTAPSL